MSEINLVDQDSTESEAWPRDFDFREQYAEQQELLTSQSDDTLAPNLPKGKNRA